MSGSGWIKSSFSFANSNCVEVRAFSDGQFEVRNSRFPDQAVLTFTQGEWDAFLAGVRAGEFDPEALASPAR